MVSCERTNCDNPGLEASFHGFDSTELSYVLVEQYEKGTGFATLKSRKFYGTAIVIANDDSVLLDKTYPDLSLDPGFDTYIRVISLNKEYKIRDVGYTNEKTKIRLGEMERCSNKVSGLLNEERFEGKGNNYYNSWIGYVTIKLNK
jgi:hypothetical protein